jgi:hypothetical protein
VYARYWLDNSGPAPRGNLPVTVHTEPSVVGSADPHELTVRVSSDRTDDAVDVPVHVVVPEGWVAEPANFVTRVDPGQFTAQAVRIAPAPDASDGMWWVRVQAEVAGQVVEDVTRVLLGSNRERELTVDVSGPAELRPGDAGSIDVMLRSAARSTISARVQICSPWHTWELLPTWDTGIELAADEARTMRLPVSVPHAAPSGSWWAVVKVSAAGLLHYSEPVVLRVGR